MVFFSLTPALPSDPPGRPWSRWSYRKPPHGQRHLREASGSLRRVARITPEPPEAPRRSASTVFELPEAPPRSTAFDRSLRKPLGDDLHPGEGFRKLTEDGTDRFRASGSSPEVPRIERRLPEASRRSRRIERRLPEARIAPTSRPSEPRRGHRLAPPQKGSPTCRFTASEGGPTQSSRGPPGGLRDHSGAPGSPPGARAPGSAASARPYVSSNTTATAACSFIAAIARLRASTDENSPLVPSTSSLSPRSTKYSSCASDVRR